MKILYITHSSPYPPNKGDRIRNFNILKHLSQSHEVHLIFPRFSDEEAQTLDPLRFYCASIKTVKLSRVLAWLRCGFSLLRKQNLTQSFFYSKGLEHLISKEEYDLVLVDCSSMAQYVLGVKKPKIIDFVDVDSDKWRLYSEIEGFPKSIIYAKEFQRLREFEGELIREFDVSLVISDHEKTLLPKTENMIVVPNGIDFEYFKPGVPQNGNTLIFTGAMNYFPNIDGVLWFHQEIWPLIKKEIPSAQFIIGGMNPPKKINRLDGEDIIVTGKVPDMREYLRKASVGIVPLRIAKGIQNKVLEAMAMELPVVSTSVANNGIQARDGIEILLGDEPEQFARAVVQVLRDNQLKAMLTRNAKRFVEENYSWSQNLQNINKAIALATKDSTNIREKISVG